jgi:hypothetical protein
MIYRACCNNIDATGVRVKKRKWKRAEKRNMLVIFMWKGLI